MERRAEDARFDLHGKKSRSCLFSCASARRREKTTPTTFVYTCRERAANAPSSPWAYLGVHQQRAAPFARASGAHDAPGVAALACARKGRGSASEPGSRAVGVTPRWRGMASFRGDEAWTARRRAGAGYARRHAPECDAPMLEVARSVHLSTWPPCIVPPCAARSEIEVAATEVVLNAGAEILVRKRARTDEFSDEPCSRERQKRSASVEFPVRDSSLFFFSTDVVAGKRASLSLTVFAPNSRSAREGQTYRLRVERGVRVEARHSLRRSTPARPRSAGAANSRRRARDANVARLEANSRGPRRPRGCQKRLARVNEKPGIRAV